MSEPGATMSDEKPDACPKCGAAQMGEPFVAKDYIAVYWKCYSKNINGEFVQDPECLVVELRNQLAALQQQLAERDEQLSSSKQDADLLRDLGNRQRREIENLRDMEDAVEALRDIGKVTGCGHVDYPDGRSRLVNCVEETIADLTARLAAAEERARAGEAKWSTKPPRQWGWYFFAPKIEDWDLAQPVRVSRIDDGKSVRYVTNDFELERNVDDFVGAAWYGPIVVPRTSRDELAALAGREGV